MKKTLPEEFRAVRLARDVYEAADRVDAVVVTTEWPEFALIDLPSCGGSCAATS